MRFSRMLMIIFAVLPHCAVSSLDAQQGDVKTAPASDGERETGPAPPSENAALQYWQAYGVLTTELSRDQLDAVEGLVKNPTEEQISTALKKAEPAFKLLHRGAQLPHCNWGLDYNDGPHMALPHLQAVRTLARFANRRAIYYFEQGRNDEAIDDLLAIYRLGRHAGSDAVNIDLLVDIAVEGVARHTLARYLPQLSADQRQALSARLEQLPPGGTISEGMLVEMRYFPQWVLDNTKDIKTAGELEKFLRDLNVDDTNISRMLAACGGDIERFRQLVQGQFDFHLEVARLFKLDRPQFQVQFAALKQKMESENPVALFWFESAPALHHAFQRHKTGQSLLMAAIAVVDEGPEALRRFQDPHGDGPFLYRPRQEGFELQSNLIVYGDARLTIQVGFDKEK